MPYLKSDALVLRCRPYSKTSQIVSALTRDYGRRAFLAKGSRRPATLSGAYDGPLDTLYRGEAVFTPRPGSGLDLLTAFALTDAHRGARRSVERFRTAMVVCELIEKSTAEDDPCPVLFDCAVTIAKRIEAAGDNEALTLRVAIGMAVLDNLGRDPQFDRCVVCARQRPESRSGVVDLEAGGIVCRRCREPGGRRMTLRGDTLTWLNNLRTDALKSLESPPPEPIIVSQANRFIGSAIEYLLDRPLYTMMDRARP